MAQTQNALKRLCKNCVLQINWQGTTHRVLVQARVVELEHELHELRSRTNAEPPQAQLRSDEISRWTRSRLLLCHRNDFAYSRYSTS